MRGPIRSVFVAAMAACAFGALTVGQASAATMEEAANPMQAIYGNPPAATPAGYGLARNFGFGTNLLFEANSTLPRKVISMEVGGLVATSQVAEFGGTLQSGKTGANNPLGLTLQFVDLQNTSISGGVGATQSFADTSDRPLITTICSPAAAAGACRTDPLFAGPVGGVKIEDVSVNLGPGFVVQGTVWGVWTDGTATTPPCIELTPRPAASTASQTLTVTQTPGAPFPAVGVSIAAISGKACLNSANNYYYTGKIPIIKIGNT